MIKHLILCSALMSAPLFVHAGEAPQAAAEQMPVNINTANAEQIAAQLKGVGLSKAKAIVAYREQNGPFTDLAQLAEVKGIGKKTLEQNSGRLQL
ncbi:ComEA family DNA-binding protein [Ferrimonas futtsuensis]|uniref:ComEA family DNA-binding protein n=1 Tax=Ferrimonas futtsuensis TaxID=364764 RepID=UPI00042A4AD9|nr:helix-hairpin-helix domain-containing protein [Ferrimonas futtsuensis]